MGADQQLMYTLHFQDSQVARVTQEGADLHIVFSSAAASRAGESVASGYLSPVLCVLKQATWQGDLAHSLGGLSDGEWQAGSVEQRQRLLLLPCELEGSVRLRLGFANGTVLHITAESLRIALDGNEQHTESYAC
jgi:hypothetical protein